MALDALLKKIEAGMTAAHLFKDGEAIVVAISGGLDSMTLLAVLGALSGKHRWRLTAAHFNHQLRGKESDGDERLARQAAGGMKIPIIVGRGAVRAEARKRGLSIEMAARELRHRFLARAAKRARSRVIALAHHQDDQVELFFLRLFRGAGGEGLAGMKWRSASPADNSIALARPLLSCSKSELRAWAEATQLPFSEDSTNACLDMLRNRVRHKLLPLLRMEFQQALETTVLRAMDLIGAESDAARALAEEWLKAPSPKACFAELPLAVQRRALQLQLYALGATVDFDLIERLRQAPGEPQALGPGEFVARETDGLVRRQNASATKFSFREQIVHLAAPAGSTTFGGLTLAWEIARKNGAGFSTALNTEQFDADKVGNEIVLRHWRPGDRFQPIGMDAPAKLQDVFTNLKTPTAERRRRVVAETAGGGIFWVQGVRLGEKFKLRSRTRRRLIWRWKAV